MRSKKATLKSITERDGISSGYSFRGKIKAFPNGNLRVIQLKDMENGYTTIGDACIFIDEHSVKDKYFLKSGDILFVSKGANNFASVFQPKDAIPSVASSVFYVIKVDPSKAIPDFVAWYINQNPVQHYFQTNAMGTYSLNINRETVENIPVQLPSLQIQEKIAKVAQLAQQEQYIYTQLKEKRNQLVEAQLLSSIN